MATCQYDSQRECTLDKESSLLTTFSTPFGRWQEVTCEPWGTTATLEKDCCRSVKPRSERLSCYGRLRTTDSVAVARKLKIHFARYGSPCLLVSDNGPQFVAVEFQKLTKESDIEHMLTSPYNNIIKRMERLRQQPSLLSNCSARLLKAEAIFTWVSLLNAILHHKVMAVAQLNGSWTEGQGLCCPSLGYWFSWNQYPWVPIKRERERSWTMFKRGKPDITTLMPRTHLNCTRELLQGWHHLN